MIPSVRSIHDKRVFLRVDYNVPLRKGKVEDNTRILASLPTIRLLLEHNCTIILGTHLGRPEGKPVPELSVKPLMEELQKALPSRKIIALPDCIGTDVHEQIQGEGDIFVLENLRFYQEEEQNSTVFAHSLASLAEVYVNDAFGNCHRKHASMVAITRFLPSFIGLLVEKEIKELRKALAPKRPSVWVLGGAKLKKISLLKLAFAKADYILLGGALPFAFLKAQGKSIGMSKTDRESVGIAQKILRMKEAKKLIFPVDYVVAEEFSSMARGKVVTQIEKTQMALDLGPETIKIFKQYLRRAHTIVWNGPLGYFEWAHFATATRDIGRFLGTLTATTIAGGGETEEAISKFHLRLTHISTGGGAMMEFLEKGTLPALDAIARP